VITRPETSDFPNIGSRTDSILPPAIFMDRW